VTLAAVADDGNGFLGKQLEVCVFVVVQLHGWPPWWIEPESYTNKCGLEGICVSLQG
jgi:hypothetical protein